MKSKLYFCLLCACLLLSGCRNSNYTSNIMEKYSQYYQYADSFKGLEIYAWKDKGINWYAVLMPGTNRLKSVQEVRELQKELPCPLSDMRKILDFYRDSGFYDFDISIISDPPKEDELTHDAQLIYNNFDTYEWLYSQLGLEFEYSENSENQSGHPTGPFVSGTYVFNSYDEVLSFYNIFKKQNTERFAIVDFDGLFPLTKYCFSSSGVNAEIIEKRIYDFDFPNPRFNILINNCDLALYDYSSFDLIDYLGVSILNDQTNIKNVNYCIKG